MVANPPIVRIEPPQDALLSRRVRAKSQDDAHDRALRLTKQMESERWVLISRSWVRSAQGGTVTLVFTRPQIRRGTTASQV